MMHIQKNVRKVYKTKCDALLDAFNKYASSKVKLTQPTGGMFAWMTMPEDVDCDEFFETCMNRNVGIIKCGAFAADGAGGRTCIPLKLYSTNSRRNHKGHGNSRCLN